MNPASVAEQLAVCARFDAEPVPCDGLKAGVSRSIRSDSQPLHGLRHPLGPGTSGWFFWTGDLPESDDFFEPVHVDHLEELRPEVVPYLALPPGWRILLAPDYEDVWFDASLLDI